MKPWVDELAVATLQFPPDHYAERLRIRKGSVVRFTNNGVATDYRVTKVSMPDECGRVQVSVTLPDEAHEFEASDPDEDDAPADTCRQCGVLQGDHP